MVSQGKEGGNRKIKANAKRRRGIIRKTRGRQGDQGNDKESKENTTKAMGMREKTMRIYGEQ